MSAENYRLLAREALERQLELLTCQRKDIDRRIEEVNEYMRSDEKLDAIGYVLSSIIAPPGLSEIQPSVMLTDAPLADRIIGMWPAGKSFRVKDVVNIARGAGIRTTGEQVYRAIKADPRFEMTDSGRGWWRIRSDARGES